MLNRKVSTLKSATTLIQTVGGKYNEQCMRSGRSRIFSLSNREDVDASH